jgi:hypothetical protein
MGRKRQFFGAYDKIIKRGKKEKKEREGEKKGKEGGREK